MSTETPLDGDEPCSKQPRMHYTPCTQYEVIPFKDEPKIKEVLLQQKVKVQFQERKPIAEPETILSNFIDPTLSPNVVSELNQDELDSPFLFYDSHLTSGFLNSNFVQPTNTELLCSDSDQPTNSGFHSNLVQQNIENSVVFLDTNLEQQNDLNLNKPETIYVKQENQDYFENECQEYQDYDRLEQNGDNFLNIKQENLDDASGLNRGNQKIPFQCFKQENLEQYSQNRSNIRQEKLEDSNGSEQCNDEEKILYLRTEESLGDSDDDAEQIHRSREQKIDLKHDNLDDSDNECSEIGMYKKIKKKLNLVKKNHVSEIESISECSGNVQKKMKFELDKSDKNRSKVRMKSKEVAPRERLPDDTVQCYRCNVQGIPRKNLMDHVRKTHNKFKTEASSEVDTYLKSLAVTNTKMETLYCEMCVEYFPSLIHLTVHVEMKHGICRWCELRFNPKKDIDHRLKHRFIKPYLFRCNCCNEEFITVLDFVSLDHQIKHTLPENSYGCIRMDRVRDFECPYCIFQTKNGKILKFHLQFHKLSNCITCKHLYLPTSKHIADVDFQKCLVCSPKLECLYESANSSIKLFHCLFCDYKCQDGIKIYDHSISCHQYCSGCCKKHPKNMIEKHGDYCENFRYYKCGVCEKNFKTFTDFKAHLKINHKFGNLCWFNQENISIKSDLVVDKILSNTQCPYCLVYIGKKTGDFEVHLRKSHGFKMCSKCSSLIQNSDVCKKCPPKKLGNWEKIDKITLERKELLNRYKK